MSQSFGVAIPEGQSPLTLGEVLALASLQILDVDLEDQPELLDQPITAEGIAVSGSLRGRGFCITASDHEYGVRINTPATSDDWRETLELLHQLGKHHGSSIEDEQGQIWGPAQIMSFPYRDDIESGISAMTSYAIEDGPMHFWGAVRRVELTSSQWQALRDSPDPVQAFDDHVSAIQSLDAYDAHPIIVMDEGVRTAFYVVTETVRTIFPKSAALPGMSPAEQPQRSRVKLVAYNGSKTTLLGDVDFDVFLAKLDPAQHREFDYSSILLTLDRAAIDRMVGRSFWRRLLKK